MIGGVMIRRSTLDRSAGSGLDTPGESRVPAAHLSLISAFLNPTGRHCHLTDARRDDVPGRQRGGSMRHDDVSEIDMFTSRRPARDGIRTGRRRNATR